MFTKTRIGVIVFALTLAAVLTLAVVWAKQSEPYPTALPVVETSSTTATPQLNSPNIILEGEWIGGDENLRFAATVSNKNIVIDMISKDVSMLYWNGTFENEAAVGTDIFSNKVESDKAVLSKADSKVFNVGVGIISFDFQAMGMTQTVAMIHA